MSERRASALLGLLFAVASCSTTSSDAAAPAPTANVDASTDEGAPPDHDDPGDPTLGDAPADDGGATGAADAGHAAASTPIEKPSDCTAARPTWLGGAIVGSDGRALNALIGVDHSDAQGRRVDAAGVPCGTAGAACCGGYSWCVRVNPSIDAAGTTDPAAVRSWGRCITAGVTLAFFEIYPKNDAGKTTFSRYGEAAHQYQPITPREPNTVGLRLPATFEATGGNTGSVAGHVTCNGAPVPVANVTRVRAWSNGHGPECGIEGYNASATLLASVGGATTYRVDYLEGGRCNAPSQSYRLYMDVLCGGAKKTIKMPDVAVVGGKTTPLDWAF